MTKDAKRRIDAYLVAGGKYHDIDFARLEILKLLAEDDRIRTKVGEDYDKIDAICASQFLVTYTCDVMPSLEQQERLRKWLEEGGHWYALHGTNSILRFLKDGKVDSPRWAPLLMQTLGSQFVAHPPIMPYKVEPRDSRHPLVEGVVPFEANDELYLSDTHGDLHVLLDTEYGGDAPGFVEDKWKKARHPVFYIHKVGKGAVLYLTLGHCRGHYDMKPVLDFYPQVEKGSWALPVYYDLLRRGISWVRDHKAA